MKFAQIIATAGIIQAALLTGAMAGENLDAIKSAGVLKIGTEGTYAPFTYHDKDNKLVGFDVEIGEAVAAKLGVKPEFVEGKWDGLIAGLDSKRYDAVINRRHYRRASEEIQLLQPLYRFQGRSDRQRQGRYDQGFC